MLGGRFQGDNTNWRLISFIGEGKYGAIWRAVRDDGQEAAVKVLAARFAQSREASQRLLREFETMSRLSHPSIPTIFDQGLTQDGQPFYVMQYFRGQTLEELVAGSSDLFNEVAVIVSIAEQALEALKYIHSAGVIHRDLSPSNLLLTPDRELKVLDFGLCTAIERSGSLTLLTGSHILGTPGFISPEQASGRGSTVTQAADIWSLGAVLFLLLSGESVYPGSSVQQIEGAARYKPRSLRAANPDIEDWLIALVDQCLFVQPELRWHDADALLAEICRNRGCPTLRRSGAMLRAPVGESTLDAQEESSSQPTICMSLQVLHGSKSSRQRIELSPGQNIAIGRDSNLTDFWLDDGYVSRQHATIAWNEDFARFAVTDDQSRNGTYLNGKPIVSEFLSAGDVLRLGRSLLGVTQGSSSGLAADAIERVAISRASVLITGESGVGKERIARQIHDRSGRTGPFVAINCAALVPGTAAAELFGHERGAFTGAYDSSRGVFRTADHGTIFLDEVGEMPNEVQSLLLRAIQERLVRPVGSTSERPIDIRIIAATNASLEERIRQSRFRLDLYARLSELVVHVPPLRDRRDEILRIFSDIMIEEGISFELQADAAEAMLLYNWPTNIRGLQRVARYVKCYHPTCNELTSELLSACEPDIRQMETTCPELESSEHASSNDGRATLRSHDALEKCIRDCAGNISEVARRLGTGRNQVYRWMSRLGLDSATAHQRWSGFMRTHDPNPARKATGAPRNSR